MSDPFGITAAHQDLLREILATAGDRIDRVAVFGSRATGRYRPNSDLDLVLYGSADAADCDRLWTLFQESSLPDAVARPLFVRTDTGLAPVDARQTP